MDIRPSSLGQGIKLRGETNVLEAFQVIALDLLLPYQSIVPYTADKNNWMTEFSYGIAEKSG